MPTTVTYSDGSLCVVDPRVLSGERPQLVETLLEQLATHEGVTALSCDLSSGRCTISWADSATSASTASAAFVEAIRAGRAAEVSQPAWRRPLWSRQKSRTDLRRPATAAAVATAGKAALFVRGPKRLLFLAAGAGSTVMTVVGLIVPGIPTVPFLLASSYFLARSSPRAHAALLATPMFGTILREWDAHEALSRTSKNRLMVFTFVIIGTTVVIAKASPVALGMMAIIAPACIYSIVRLPEIKEQPQPLERTAGTVAGSAAGLLAVSHA
jgi:uncharacterized membrane protein YbaN (DUF454 family)